MNLIKPFKYQLHEFRKSIAIFYLVIAILYLFIGTATVFGGKDTIHFGGMEFSTVVFLFVCGLNSFKENFNMLIQNSVSRKNIFVSRILSFLVICAGMTVIDTALVQIMKLLVNVKEFELVNGIFEQIYGFRYTDQNSILMLIRSLPYIFTLYMAAVTVGYFITILYYRMNTALKTIVSVGVPVTVLFILPYVDFTFFHGSLSATLGKALYYVYDYPIRAILSFLIISIISGGFGWLLTRKAVTKSV